jgi:hypothetical protein
MKTINNVTTENLSAALRICQIDINYEILDRIIDVVELLEEKGKLTTLKDINNLKSSWL